MCHPHCSQAVEYVTATLTVARSKCVNGIEQLQSTRHEVIKIVITSEHFNLALTPLDFPSPYLSTKTWKGDQMQYPVTVLSSRLQFTIIATYNLSETSNVRAVIPFPSRKPNSYSLTDSRSGGKWWVKPVDSPLYVRSDNAAGTSTGYVMEEHI